MMINKNGQSRPDSDNSSDSNDNKSTEDKLNDFLEQQVIKMFFN